VSRWPLLSAFVAVLLAGCGGTEESLPADYRGVDVPRRTADYVAPSPESFGTGLAGPTPEQTVRARVERVLLPQIRQQVVTPVTCAGPVRPDGTTRTVRCHAPWRGVQVPFDVEISGPGKPFYTMKVRQLQGLLLATAVRDAWSVERKSGDRPLSCEAGMPEVALVPLDTPTPYRCASGTDLYTVRVEIQGDTSRIAFDPVR
jgi:hypothetical protein